MTALVEAVLVTMVSVSVLVSLATLCAGTSGKVLNVDSDVGGGISLLPVLLPRCSLAEDQSSFSVLFLQLGCNLTPYQDTREAEIKLLNNLLF